MPAFDVRLEPIDAADVPSVAYQWDPDTEILRAALRSPGVAEGLTGSLDIEGADGAWLMLELANGRLTAVEVAVWPEVRTVERLDPPPAVPARFLLPAGGTGLEPTAVEVETPIRAVADRAERTIHFRIGPPRPSRAVRVAGELLLELDGRAGIAGLWFLNVPPFPCAR